MCFVGCGNFAGLNCAILLIVDWSCAARFLCVILHWLVHCCRIMSLDLVALGVAHMGKVVIEVWCFL